MARQTGGLNRGIDGTIAFAVGDYAVIHTCKRLDNRLSRRVAAVVVTGGTRSVVMVYALIDCTPCAYCAAMAIQASGIRVRRWYTGNSGIGILARSVAIEAVFTCVNYSLYSMMSAIRTSIAVAGKAESAAVHCEGFSGIARSQSAMRAVAGRAAAVVAMVIIACSIRDDVVVSSC